jgi:putative Mg2+ transporter-C (MgtC) family protein
MGDVAYQLEILLEVSTALILGGIIGLEREAAEKPAGFRTQMMVSGAAALIVGLASVLLTRFETDARIQTDPIRVLEAIVTAVGFLGAGTIFRRSATDHVEGLTTAASLLMSAGVGIAVALDQLVLAVGVTLLSLTVLYGLRVVEDRVRRKGAARR